MLRKAGISADLKKLLVDPMDDGDMGSLRFFSNTEDPRFGKEAAECKFEDSDGVPVSATLNLDQDGELLELDVWKVDFSRLNRWPNADEISD